jgi:hypothetical protein
MLITILLAVVTCTAFALIHAGVDVPALKELLAVVFPSLVALTAAGVGRGRDS